MLKYGNSFNFSDELAILSQREFIISTFTKLWVLPTLIYNDCLQDIKFIILWPTFFPISFPLISKANNFLSKPGFLISFVNF